MAGIKADGRLRLVEHDAELLLHLGGGALEVRRQPASIRSRSHKSRSPERRQTRAAACSFVTSGWPTTPDHFVINPQACR